MKRKMFSVRRGKVVFANNLIQYIKRNQCPNVLSILDGITFPQDLVDSDRTTLLHLSAKYNNETLTKSLIESGCDVDAKNIYDETPLLWAVRSNSYNTIKQLLGKNADIYTVGPDSKCILEILLTSQDEIPIVIIKYLFAILKNDCRDDEELANVLTMVKCPLYYIVLFKNAEFTRKMILRVFASKACNPVNKDLIWEQWIS